MAEYPHKLPELADAGLRRGIAGQTLEPFGSVAQLVRAHP